MAERIIDYRKWVVIACIVFYLGACATPAQKNTKYAVDHGLQRLDIQGTDFIHAVFINHENRGNVWHIYIEGDGKPWIAHRFVAQDPTTNKPLMLRLMAQDNAPAIYLGRPCYQGHNDDRSCNPLFWTHRRYSDRIVASMAAALKKLIGIHSIKTVALIGHSGGGTLAMLLAERIKETKTVVTLAGNLDIDAWADQHRFARLQGSLNPALLKPLPSYIRQYHYLGKRDRNITASLTMPVVKKQKNAELFLLDDYRHNCCWEEDWQVFLEKW